MVIKILKVSAILLTIVVFLFCCEKGYEDHSELYAELGQQVEGSTAIFADQRAGTIHFKAKGNFSDADLRVKLVKPDGSVAFYKDFSGSEELDLHLSYPPENGEWSLYYFCKKGLGEILFDLYN